MLTRYAVPEDLPMIAEMYSEFNGVEFENFGMKFDRQLTQLSIEKMMKVGKVIVCETGGKIISMMAGILSPSMSSDDLFFMACLFYVQVSFRSFTPRFLKDCERLIKESHATQLVLAVPAFSNFEKSERFYSIAGFKTLETHWVKKI